MAARVEKWAEGSAVRSSARSGPGWDGWVRHGQEGNAEGHMCRREWAGKKERPRWRVAGDGGRTDLYAQCSHTSPQCYGRIPCMGRKGWELC